MLQGEAQCCVTGAALEHILQLGNASLLEAVMNSVVVFSRMRPYQKGQVMSLLSSTGLHQLIQGQQHHLPVGASLSLFLALLPALPLSFNPLLPINTPSYPSDKHPLQLLMALMFNTSFYMDGSRSNNQQVSCVTCGYPRATTCSCCTLHQMLLLVSVLLGTTLDCI